MSNPHHDWPAFRPHPLVRGGHAQTLAGVYLPGMLFPYRARQHQVRLEDGDVIVLHDDCPRVWRAGNRVVLLIHGLGGSHASGYMIRIAGRLNQRGVRTMRMDLRDCGQGRGLARGVAHAGRSEDARSALAAIARLCPGSPVALLGFSMGGNIALKTLAEMNGDRAAGLDRAAVVAPPIELLTCAENIHQGLNRIYDRNFVRFLFRHAAGRRDLAQWIKSLRRRRQHRCRLIDFDNDVTAPASGFRDAADYYGQCSSAGRLHQIDLPTLILSAEDDPLIPVEMFRRARLSPEVTLHVATGGGHLGFIGDGRGDPDRRWMDWRLIQWITDAGDRDRTE